MTSIGKLEARQRLTVVRKLCGQVSIAPKGVADQSLERIKSPMMPPPVRKSRVCARGVALSGLKVKIVITSEANRGKGIEWQGCRGRDGDNARAGRERPENGAT